MKNEASLEVHASKGYDWSQKLGEKVKQITAAKCRTKARFGAEGSVQESASAVDDALSSSALTCP